MLASLAGSVVAGLVSVIPGLAKVLGDTLVARGNTEAVRQGAENTTGKELTMSWLTSVNDTNNIKLKGQTERTVLFSMIAFATPCALIYWAACLDSVPFYLPYLMESSHRVGAWRVGVPPELKDDFHMIVQSFFIAAPTLGGIAMLTKAFRH